MAYLLKTGLAMVTEKVFEKAGGLQGIKDKSTSLVKNVKEHASEVSSAVKNKSTSEGAEALGSIVGDIAGIVKDAGTAAVEIGSETVEETKEQIKEVKKVFSNNKTPKA